MTQARDLRVGDWVIDIEDGNYYQIPSGLSINNSHLMNPIPLTEEILLKCGFKQLDKYTFYKSKFLIHHRKRGFVIRKSMPIIKYLHQLQIAYKVFTDKEIDVQL